LWVAAIGILITAAAIPFSPMAGLFGFTALPLRYFLALAFLVLVYLAMAQAVKTWFYRSRLAPKQT
jgi:Mg2+-importing ATPase